VRQLVLEDLREPRRQVELEAPAVLCDRISPAIPRILRGTVLQLQQMLDDHACVVENLAALCPPQCLDLLDQVGEIQRLEPALAQQPRLHLAPDVKILVVKIFGLSSNLRSH
jgi:hypothetical protein